MRVLLDGADSVEVLQSQAGALPNLTNPLVEEFVDGSGLAVRPKLGWTDVARFAARGSRRSTSAPAIRRSRTPRASSSRATRSSAPMRRLAQFVGVDGARFAAGPAQVRQSRRRTVTTLP